MIIYFQTKPKDTTPPVWTWNPQVVNVVQHPNEIPTPNVAGPWYINGSTVYYGMPANLVEVEEGGDGFRLNKLAVDGSSILYTIDSSELGTFHGFSGQYHSAVSPNGKRIAVMCDGMIGVYDDNLGDWVVYEFDMSASPQETYSGRAVPVWLNNDILIIPDDLTYNFEVIGDDITKTVFTNPFPAYTTFRDAITIVADGGPNSIYAIPTDPGVYTDLTIGLKRWNFTNWITASPSAVIAQVSGNFTTATFNAIPLGNDNALITWADWQYDEVGSEGRRFYAVVNIDIVGVTLMSNIVYIDGWTGLDDRPFYSVFDNDRIQGWAVTGTNRVVQCINTGDPEDEGLCPSNRLIELTWDGTFGSGLSITQDIENVDRAANVVTYDTSTNNDPRFGVGRGAKSAGFNPSNGHMYVMDEAGVRTIRLYSLE